MLRAALACILAGPQSPDLLILDEATNQLDFDAIAAIVSVLSGYDGTLLTVIDLRIARGDCDRDGGVSWRALRERGWSVITSGPVCQYRSCFH